MLQKQYYSLCRGWDGVFAEQLIRFFVGKVKSLIHEGFLRLFSSFSKFSYWWYSGSLKRVWATFSFPQFLTLTPAWHLLPALLDPTSLINPGPSTDIVTSCLLSTLLSRHPTSFIQSSLNWMRWGHPQPHFLHWLIFPAKILECSPGHWYCTVPLSGIPTASLQSLKPRGITFRSHRPWKVERESCSSGTPLIVIGTAGAH